MTGTDVLEPESNVVQVLKVILAEKEEFKVSDIRYISPVTQNELLDIMAHDILRSKLTEIKERRHFTIMADESSDVSNRVQMCLVLRLVGVFIDRIMISYLLWIEYLIFFLVSSLQLFFSLCDSCVYSTIAVAKLFAIAEIVVFFFLPRFPLWLFDFELASKYFFHVGSPCNTASARKSWTMISILLQAIFYDTIAWWTISEEGFWKV